MLLDPPPVLCQLCPLYTSVVWGHAHSIQTTIHPTMSLPKIVFIAAWNISLCWFRAPLWILEPGKEAILYCNYPDENLHARHMKQLLVFAGDVGDKFFEPSTLPCFDKVAVKDPNLDSDFIDLDNSCWSKSKYFLVAGFLVLWITESAELIQR